MGQEQRINNTMPDENRPPTAAVGTTAAVPSPAASATTTANATAAGTAKAGTPKHGTAKGGAPARNANRLTHGLYSRPDQQSYRLTLGTLPTWLAGVEDDAYAYRLAVEAAAHDVAGSISLTAAHNIDTATRCHRHALICQRLMRDAGTDEALTPAQRRAETERLSDQTCRAAAARDKAIERLDLDRAAKGSIWDRLDRRPVIAAPEALQPAAPSAATIAPEADTPPGGPANGPDGQPAAPDAPAGRVGVQAADAMAGGSGDLRVPLSFG